MKKLLLFLSVCLIVLTGCKEGYLSKELNENYKGKAPSAGLDKTEALAGEFDAEYGEEKADFEEKVIRTAYVTIMSGKVNESYDKTLSLVKKYKGMIVNSSTSKYEESEEAIIEIKIPPKHFLTLLDELKTIGKVESKNISEEDVTEEYYDIEARLNNARKVQERFFDLLKKAYRVEDVLKVEREIERVGEKIETLEGRIRYLDSKTDYARITVTIYNKRVGIIKKSGIKNGFIKSFQIAIHFFFGIIYFIIIIIPLIILIIVIWIIIALIIRRRRRRR